MTDSQKTPDIEAQIEDLVKKLEEKQGRKIELEQSLNIARRNRDGSPEGSSTRSIAETEYEEIYEQIELLENQITVLEADYRAAMTKFCEQFSPKSA